MEASQRQLPERYALEGQLGDGAEGGAMLAVDREGGGRRVVLKRVDATTGAGVVRSFQVLRVAGSPHLPEPVAMHRDPDGAWLVTGFVEGSPLERGPAPLDGVVSELLGVARALSVLHELGTHHGDVSLTNVVRSATGGVVLTDFGTLGCLGTGTPGFLAPEVLGGGGGPAADLFALGCLATCRLFGEVPWARPEQLVPSASGGLDPVARIVALRRARAGEELEAAPLALWDLLANLLDPDPGARPASARAVVSRLEQLQHALRAGVAPGSVRWSVPRQMPYRGPALDAVVKTVAGRGRPPGLVAVRGPSGAGRGRVVAELTAELELAAPGSARTVASEHLSAALGEPALPVVAAWLSPRAPDSEAVLAVRECPVWGVDIPDGVDPAERAVARTLVGAARLAQRCIVAPVGDALGAALGEEAGNDPAAVVLELAPWTREAVAQVVDRCLHTEDAALRREWVDALVSVTGGWPGAVVRAVTVCAHAGFERPTARVRKQLAESIIDDDALMDATRARTVLEVRWGLAPHDALEAAARVEGGAAEWAVAAARRRLGGDEVVAAIAGAALRRGDLAPPDGPLAWGRRLALALDARDASAVAEALTGVLAERDGSPSSPELGADGPTSPPAVPARATTLRSIVGAALRWLDRAAPATNVVDHDLRRRGAAWAIRHGDATLAARLTEGVLDAACAIEHARALHRLGHAARAHALLGEVTVRREGAPGSAASAASLRARALAWRVGIDLGRAREGADQALEVVLGGPVADQGRLGVEAMRRAFAEFEAELRGELDDGSKLEALAAVTAEVGVWGGMALVYAGDVALGAAWIEAALDRAEAAGLRARALQLLGNLALASGDQLSAARRFRAAQADFIRSGEPAAGYLLDGSLAGVAWHLGDVRTSRARARRALGAALARGQVDAVVACFHNLALSLLAVGQGDLARRELTVVRRVVSGAGVDACSAARLDRIETDLLAARLGAPGRREAAEAYRRAAETLGAAGLVAEAADARLEASRRARRAGALREATEDLRAAESLVTDAAPLEVRLGLALTVFEASDDVRSMDAAARRLAVLPGPEALARSGQLRLAWTYDLALLRVVQRVHGRGHARGLAAAHRLVRILDTLLEKVDPMDRKAALERLVTDDGDPAPLHAIMAELGELEGALGEVRPANPAAETVEADGGGRGAPGGESSPTAAGAGGRMDTERVLRSFRRVAREHDFARLLEQVVEAAMELTGAERGAVVALDHDGGRVSAARELAGDGDGVQYSSSVIDRVIASGDPVLSVDASADARFDQSKSISHLNLRSVLAAPLRAGGELLGAIYVDHRLRRGAFTEADLAQVEDFADLAALALANARSMGSLRARTVALDEERRELEARLEASRAELTGLREQVRASSAETRHYRGMIGACDAMHRVFRLIDRLADSDVPVVIHGESGTGKELVARAIHDAGGRATRPFVAENCGAIPETLLESVLFGHARGAFTGAHQARPGLFEAADAGTIFLDEIGEMSPAMQTKLLRVLQEGEVRRVGENGHRKVNVRVLAASNRDLEEMVEAGSFRRDLYYRVCVVKVELPPLRARREDLPPLVEHFLDRCGGAHLEVSAAAMRALARYPWPGNVRELENEVQRWVALVEDRVTPEDLGPAIRDRQTHDAADPDDLRLKPRVELLERELIRQALERTQGNQTQAAQLLGLSRYGLQKKLKRLEQEGDGADVAG